MKWDKITYGHVIPLVVASVIFFGALLYATIAMRDETAPTRGNTVVLEMLHDEVYALTQKVENILENEVNHHV